MTQVDGENEGRYKTKSKAISQETLFPELAFGLVGPLGCNVDAAQDALVRELTKVGYKSEIIHLTRDVNNIIPEVADISRGAYSEKIKLMNDIVEMSGKADFLARIALASISARRIRINREENKILGRRAAQVFQAESRAYIIGQLKRRQEATLLSKVYGRKFVQVSIVVSESEQLESVLHIVGRERPELAQTKRLEEARKLIDRDKEEAGIDFGQNLLGVYHQGDVFVGGGGNEISLQIARFIEAFFGSNYISPNRDEVGAYLAKAASLRTLDLSRQVGAAIFSEEGDVISIGCNEVPSPLGGNYWCDDKDPQRDIERGVEANKLETTRLIHNFVHAISKLKGQKIEPSKILAHPEIETVLKEAFVSDITEFGRMTHAEMSALADAARIGRATKASTIYVTTFPCHNCAKHLVAAGVQRIVYIEPYAKSKAFELSGDALTSDSSVTGKVRVEHFIGISPKRYREIFEKPHKRRDDGNRIKRWHYDRPTPMVEDKSWVHTVMELQALVGMNGLLAAVKDGLQAQVGRKKRRSKKGVPGSQ